MSEDLGRRTLRWAGLLLVGVATAGLAGVVVASGQDAGLLLFVPLVVSYGAVGAVIVRRRPDNTIGWLFLGSAVFSAVGVLAKAIGTAAIPEGAGASTFAVWAAWFSLVYVELVSLPLVLAFLLFPDGRPLSRRWGHVAVAAVVTSVLGAGIVAVSDVDFGADGSNFPGMVHPLRLLDEQVMAPIYATYQAVELVLLVLSVAALALRYHRSAGIVRLQVRWVLAAVGVAVVGFLVSLALLPDLAPVAFGLLFALVPVACGVGILRYHLYDIDRVISRTASYAVVTGLLVATYAVVVTSVSRLLGETSTLAVAAATLAAAALGRPLLRRVQRVVDRRFNRSRFDAERTVEEFGARLRDRVDPEVTEAELLDVVRRTMAPRSVSMARAGTTVTP